MEHFSEQLSRIPAGGFTLAIGVSVGLFVGWMIGYVRGHAKGLRERAARFYR